MGGGEEEGEQEEEQEEAHDNLTTAAHVRQSLMLLTLNALFHPPSHLTLITNYPDLLDSINSTPPKKKQKTKADICT